MYVYTLDRLSLIDLISLNSNHVEDGLKDTMTKMLTFFNVGETVYPCPSAVLQRLDRLVEPLRATCTTGKGKLSKQEF